MICSKCGTINDQNNKFCKNCGQQLSKIEVPSPPVLNQSTTINNQTYPTPPVSPAANIPSPTNTNSSKKLILIIIIIILIVFGLLGVVASFSIFKNASTRYNPSSATTHVSSSTASSTYPTLPPVSSPTPFVAASSTPKLIKFPTINEAYNYAATPDNVPNLASAKLSEVDILFSESSKQWTFYFWTGGINITKIMVNDSGNFSKSTTTDYTLNNSFMLSMPDPKTIISSNFIDAAKQKMVGLGFQPSSTILSAKYTICATCTDHKQKWTIILPLAGEETKSTMKAKEFVFQDGSYTQSSDVTFFIY